MRFQELRGRLQRFMEQDVDAVFEEFVEETGSEELEAFLAHLHEYGLLEEDQYASLVRDLDGSLADPEFDEDEADAPPEVEEDEDDQPTADPHQTIDPADFSWGDDTEGDSDPDANATIIPTREELDELVRKAQADDHEEFADLPDEEEGTDETLIPNLAELQSKATPPPAPPPLPQELQRSSVVPAAPRLARPPRPSQPDPEPEPESEPEPEPEPEAVAEPEPKKSKLEEPVITDVSEPRRRRRRRKEPEHHVPDPVPQGAERYEFVGSVGEGAMGKVHLAVDTALQRKVAFKQMSMDIAKEATMASKFNQEAQITAQLDHPNIVPVYNIEIAPDGMAAYTMKLIKGRTLEELIDEAKELYAKSRRAKMPEHLTQDAFLEHFLRACDAMYYAHSRGVVHRDLKPENIMVGEFGELYVMDWGIAKVFATEIDDPVSADPPQDEGDLIIGTPQYLSPEQAEGENDTLDAFSDQYALGLILFELMCLKPAVTGKSPMKIAMRQQDAEKDPLKHIAGQRIAPEIKAIIHKATSKAKNRRYPDVHELAEDIRRYLRGESVKAKRDNPWQALMRFVGRHRELTFFTMMAGAFASFTLIVATLAWYQWSLSQQQVREGQLSNLLTTVGRQASLIDGQFLKYEGLLSVIATNAEQMLERTAPADVVVYSDTTFGTEKQPKDAKKSKRYDMTMSLEHSAFVTPKGVRPSTLHGEMRRLAPLRRQYHDVMLRSLSEEAANFLPNQAWRAVADKGVPLSWAYVGLETGLYQVFPGHHTTRYKKYDPRETAWYELAKKERGPQWGAPHADDNGMGRLVLTCATSLHDNDDNVLGVAGIDVTFDFIIEELLRIDGFPEDTESFLVDDNGKIVVRSSRAGQQVSTSLRSKNIRMPAFPVKAVVDEIGNLKSGYVVEGDDIIIYNRMHSLGWYYVLQGDEDALLGAVQ